MHIIFTIAKNKLQLPIYQWPIIIKVTVSKLFGDGDEIIDDDDNGKDDGDNDFDDD